MRGSPALKKILENNKKYIETLIKSIGVYNIMVLMFYLYKKQSIKQFILLSGFEVGAFAILLHITNPVIIKENNIEELKNVVSVNSPGIIAFCFDLMFWSMLTKVLVVFSPKWYFIYLGIPFSLIMEILVKPLKKMKTL